MKVRFRFSWFQKKLQWERFPWWVTGRRGLRPSHPKRIPSTMDPQWFRQTSEEDTYGRS